LQEWVRLYDDVEHDYLPPPTLSILVDAVAHTMGGANIAVATALASKYSISVYYLSFHRSGLGN